MDTRMRTAMHVYFFLVLGVFLVLVPWSSIWNQAVLLFIPGSLGSVLRSGWVRGAVCGLGILDLFVAVREARALWREYPAGEEERGS